jgi:hypothetical protein
VTTAVSTYTIITTWTEEDDTTTTETYTTVSD